tara:strand:- start:1089 stop:1727 length:639 start_codon:yes stop_codon:yes gene_type:complete
MPNEEEIFSRQAMVEVFDVDRISTGGPIFDQTKLKWVNAQYLRALSTDEYAQRVSDWMLNPERLKQLVPLVQERAERLSDLVPIVDYLIGERRVLVEADFQHKSLQRDEVVRVLYHTLAAFEEMRSWQREEIYTSIQALAVACDMKVRDYLFPLFIAVSGRSVSLPLFDSLVFLGAPLSLGRLRNALEVFAVSGKERKRLDKEYQKLQWRQD